MIMLAKVVPYGGNSVKYALEKENAKTVKVNHMPESIDPTSIWYMMKHHCQLYEGDRTVGRKLDRFMVTFVISPSKEESADFTMDDWARLQDEALEVLDSVGLIPKGMDKEVKTNFRNSMNVGGLHSDSKSGTLHLHIDCCRVDLDGKTNDVHDIHERAMKAAEVINMRRGWKQPKEIRDMRQKEIADFCDYVLRNMQQFDIDRYFRILRMKGYEVNLKYDKQKKLVGYTVGKNASVLKASEIGRRFMASQLEATWENLHPNATKVKLKPSSGNVTTMSKPYKPVVQPATFTQTKVGRGNYVEQPKSDSKSTIFNIPVGDEIQQVSIPDSVKDLFATESIDPVENTAATVNDVANTAMLLFAGYIEAATHYVESHGGGGSTPSSGWGKKDDEDDRQFAERCIQMARSMCKPKRRIIHR